jgi:putative colanic acid biosynthesis UDP-glucose lipid carrier transferase
MQTNQIKTQDAAHRLSSDRANVVSSLNRVRTSTRAGGNGWYSLGPEMATTRSQGILEQYRRSLAMVQKLLDGVIVFILLFSLCRYFGIPFSNYYFELGLIAFLLTLVTFQWSRLYRPWRGANLGSLARQTSLAWIMVAAILAFLGYLTKTSDFFSRKVVTVWIMLAPLGLLGIRVLVHHYLRWYRARGHNMRSVVIGGAGDLGAVVAKKITDPWLGMQLLGFFDDFKMGENVRFSASPTKDFPVLGDLNVMAEFVNEHRVDMVYLALPMRAEERIRQVVDSLKDTTASVYLIPDVFAFDLLQASLSDLQGIPIISLWDTPFTGINNWLKRGMDIVLASVFLLLGLPLMGICALGIKLSSPGPVLFRQRRYGLDGEKIVVYKFRTMTVCLDGPEVPISVRHDHRVTPFGAFLRRHSLDELPQLFNIFVGTMSFVGPRPHAVSHNEFYRSRIPGYMLRHKVRPGLTGWAQINGWRGEAAYLEKMEKRLEFDLDYLRRWSPWLDLKIIFKTAFLVFKDENAL